jgi:ubiquinone/menaquinone biosynthesis C-methylase UbiE
LDIGVGTGFILSYVKQYINNNAQFFGVDLEASKSLPPYIQFKMCDIEKEPLPFENDSFDVVISTFVIEHLTTPWNMFAEAYRVLRKGGYLLCVTEYVTSLFMPDYWNFYQDPTHVRPYTKRSLEILLKMAHFKKHKIGLIRAWEYVPFIPFVPILNLISNSNFSFIPFEILGRTVYCVGQKDEHLPD